MSPSDTTSIPLTVAQMQQASALLARVFQHDPLMKFLFVDGTDMLTKPVRFYRAALRMGWFYGQVYTTPAVEGVAIWVSPGNTDLTIGQIYRCGFLTAVLSAGLKPLGRFIKVASYIEKVKKQVLVTRPHWNLVLFGIDPSQQSKGVGGSLLQPILDRADAEGLPCYLESANERNLTFYRRQGFEAAVQGQVPQGGPPLWFMLREPGQRKTS